MSWGHGDGITTPGVWLALGQTYWDTRRMPERRRHQRIALQSQVEVTHFEVAHQLRVADASRSGLFLEAQDLDGLPEFTVGAEVNVRLFDASLDEDADVLAMATVVRVVRGSGVVASGVALSFTEVGPGDLDRLDALLELHRRDQVSN